MPALKELCGIVEVSDEMAIEVLDPGRGRRVAGIDDQYNIDALPESLKALPSVVISRGDWKRKAPGFSFKISAPAEVYLAVHNRGGFAPPNGWEKTDITLTWWRNQCADTVYRKRFDTGDVKIPGHHGSDKGNYGIPHTAFVKGAGVRISE
jgi:hypothetical protein